MGLSADKPSRSRRHPSAAKKNLKTMHLYAIVVSSFGIAAQNGWTVLASENVGSNGIRASSAFSGEGRSRDVPLSSLRKLQDIITPAPTPPSSVEELAQAVEELAEVMGVMNSTEAEESAEALIEAVEELEAAEEVESTYSSVPPGDDAEIISDPADEFGEELEPEEEETSISSTLPVAPESPLGEEGAEETPTGPTEEASAEYGVDASGIPPEQYPDASPPPGAVYDPLGTATPPGEPEENEEGEGDVDIDNPNGAASPEVVYGEAAEGTTSSTVSAGPYGEGEGDNEGDNEGEGGDGEEGVEEGSSTEPTKDSGFEDWYQNENKTPAPGPEEDVPVPTPLPSYSEDKDEKGGSWEWEWDEPTGPTSRPSPRPTEKYIPKEDDPLMEEIQPDTADIHDDDNVLYHGLGGAVGSYLDGVESPQEMERDKNVQIVAGVLVGLFLVMMLVTVHFVTQYPDGLCAGCCRLTLKIICCFTRTLCLPCRALCCKGSDQSQGRRTHAPMRTPFPSDLELA